MRVSLVFALALLSTFCGGGGGKFSDDGFGSTQAPWWSRLPLFPLSDSSMERAASVEMLLPLTSGAGWTPSLVGGSFGRCGCADWVVVSNPASSGRRMGTDLAFGCFGDPTGEIVVGVADGSLLFLLVPPSGLVPSDGGDKILGAFDQYVTRSGVLGRGGLRPCRRRARLVVAAARELFQLWQDRSEAGVFGPGPGLNPVRVGFDGPLVKPVLGLKISEGLVGVMAVPTPPE